MDLLLSLALFFITGAVSGLLGGMLGIGGATVLVPALTLLYGIPIHMAIAVSLLNNVAVSLSSTLRYRKMGLLDRRVIYLMNIGSVVGIILGTFIATRSPGDAIKVLFGAFLLFMVANGLLRRSSTDLERMPELNKAKEGGLAGLGFVMGLMGALLGLGGGTVAVPMLNNIFKMPLKRAIANSLATIILASALGAVIYFYLGAGTLFPADEALLTAVTIVPGSIVGAMIGTRISEGLHTKYIKYIFYVLLLYIAYSMIRSGLGW